MRSAGGHWLVGVQVSGHDESINNRQFQMGKNHTTITAVCEVQIYFIQSGEFQAGLGRDQMVFINVKVWMVYVLAGCGLIYLGSI